MIIYVDAQNRCHIVNDGAMRAVETNFFDGKCQEYIAGYCYEEQQGIIKIYPWRNYSELAEIQNAVDRNSAEWEEKMVEAEFATDEDGNRYHREVGTDGEYHLVLIESYTGELFQ